MFYTSYFGQLRSLVSNGIEPIAISRSTPKGFAGERRLDIAPTWAMLKMSDEQYNECYERILASVDVHKFAERYKGRDVAFLCWEKDINDCHRKRVGEWLREAGYECEEFGVVAKPASTAPKKKPISDIITDCIQLSMF